MASLPQMGLLGKTIFASEAFFAYVILAKGLAAKLSAIRRCDRRFIDDLSRHANNAIEARASVMNGKPSY